MTQVTFHHTRLPNGLTVIGEHNPQAQSVAAGYFVNTGSRDETPQVAGVSHFLEHMMFKGSDRRSAEDINREFDEMGARNNAYTSEEHTVYYGSVLPEYRERLLDLLSDMMRPALRQEDFDVEKKVILEEIAMYQDRPNIRVFDMGAEKFFAGHPLGNSVLGTPDTIGPLEREQMLRYFRARYAPNNLTLVLAGNYDWSRTLAQVQALTEEWEPQDTGREFPELQAHSGHETIVDEKLKRSHIGLWAPGPSAQSDLRYAAAILGSVIGDSSGSRLYWSLVDKGLADAAQLWHDPGDRAGAFMGYLSTASERAQAVLDTARGILEDLPEAPPTAEEWERAQRKLATSITLQGETPFGRLMSLGNSFLYNQAYVSVDDLLDEVMSATREQAQAIIDEGVFEQVFSLTLGPSARAADASSTDAQATAAAHGRD